jgi:hypothetical protein
LIKATISFVMSVRPHGTIRLFVDGFLWNLIFQVFPKSVEKIEILLNSDKNEGTLYKYIAEFFFKWEVFQIIVVEKTYVLYSKTFPRKSCRLWDNLEKCGGARHATANDKTRCTRFTCWITKATNTLRMCILIVFLRQEWLQELALVRSCTYFACSFKFTFMYFPNTECG